LHPQPHPLVQQDAFRPQAARMLDIVSA
jgi:hypothetical protein